VGPKGGFGFLAVEEGDIFPVGDGIHGLLGQGAGKSALVEKFFLRLEEAGEDHAGQLSIGAIDGENPLAAGGDAQIEKSRLNLESGGIGEQADGKGIFKRLFDESQGQRGIQIERWIVPIKLHKCKSNGHAL
jgi:hypothetical protein